MTEANFAGKIILVTGASRGLGYAVAKQLAALGAQVIATARTMGGLEELDDQIQAQGHHCTIVQADLRKQNQVAGLAGAIAQRWGRLDMLVHCAAAGGQLAQVHHIESKDWAQNFETNATAVYHMIAAFDPLLSMSKEQRATAMFCLDHRADQANWGAYGASKRAGESIARAYAIERSNWVDVRFFSPPEMPTALRSRAWPGQDSARLTTCAQAADSLIQALR